MSPVLKEKLRQVERALKRLSPEQGLVARRNARRAVGAAVRALKTAVESAYPSLVLSHYKPILGTLAERENEKEKRLKARGFIFTTAAGPHACALAAGIRGALANGRIWLPGWVMAVDYTDHQKATAQLRKAKSNPKYRKSLETVRALVDTA